MEKIRNDDNFMVKIQRSSYSDAVLLISNLDLTDMTHVKRIWT